MKENVMKNEDQRLEMLFGEALGDLPTKEETQEAWDVFIKQKKKRHQTYKLSFVMGIAASFLFIAGYFLQKPYETIEVFTSVESPTELRIKEEKENIIVCTPATFTTTINLPDGTIAILSANSRLEYPKQFTNQERRIKLIGKARFEVVKDLTRPFVVISDCIQTRVLGTVFDVESYIGQKPKVTLYEGCVQVSDIKGKQVEEIIPGEQASFTARGKIQTEEVDLKMEESWINEEFQFDNVSLESVLREIGAWYNMSVTFYSNKLLKERIHLRMERKVSIERLLEALNDLQIARFEIKKQEIIVSCK